MQIDFNNISEHQKQRFAYLMIDYVKHPVKENRIKKWKVLLKMFVKTFPMGIITYFFYRGKADPTNEETIKLFEDMAIEHKKTADAANDEWLKNVLECFVEMDKITADASRDYVEMKKIKDESKHIKDRFLANPNFEDAKEIFLYQIKLLELGENADKKFKEKAKVQKKLEKLYNENWDKRKNLMNLLKTAYITASVTVAKENPAMASVKFDLMVSVMQQQRTARLMTNEILNDDSFKNLKEAILSKLNSITDDTLKSS